MVNEFPASPPDLAAIRIAIVVSQYNQSVTDKLCDGAAATLTEHGVPSGNIDVFRVPGAWEIPLLTRRLAQSGRYAGLICLGAVIRGETTHDQHINRFVSQAIGQLSLEFELPIAFGVLTCHSFEQAHARAGGKIGNKGTEAAQTTLHMIGLLQSLDPSN